MGNFYVNYGSHQYQSRLKDRWLKHLTIKYCSNSTKYASSNPKKKFFDSTASIVSCKVTTRKYIKKAALLIGQFKTALTEHSAKVSWLPTFEELDITLLQASRYIIKKFAITLTCMVAFIFRDNLKTYKMQWLWRGNISGPLFKVSLNLVLTDKPLNQCLWSPWKFLWSIGTLKHWLFIKTCLPEYVSLFADIETIDTIGSLNLWIQKPQLLF